MKKKLSLLLVLVMVFSIFITACGDKELMTMALTREQM